MKILVLAGGSGSEALQYGLFEMFGKDGVDYKVLINCYDNGKSTGIVRKVAGGKILGPSDLRKNQCLRAKLMHGQTPLLTFLDLRLSHSSAEDMKKDILDRLEKIEMPNNNRYYIEVGIQRFFHQPEAAIVDYTDFSVANIIYAGLAIANDNSLAAAGRLFEHILNIPVDSVIVNSDESLFLTAKTEGGFTILDEGDIVNWNDPTDKIVDIELIDNKGEVKVPTLHEKAERAIAEADMIIFSSGTQWSSLIPTYVTEGCQKALEMSKAKKYLVMNLTEDKDSTGVSAHDWVSILGKYIPMWDLEVISSVHADPSMQLRTNYVVSKPGMKSHSSSLLVKEIFLLYFKEFLMHDAHFVFDYDDTLIPRNGVNSAVAKENAFLFRILNRSTCVSICSGNSINSITAFNERGNEKLNNKIRVFADNGINCYELTPGTGDRSINPMTWAGPDTKFSPERIQSIIEILHNIGIPTGKIQNRGNVSIAIKPIDAEYRTIITNLLRDSLDFSNVVVTATGRTTIEITKKGFNKAYTIERLQGERQVVYVGDEFDGGNDAPILEVPGVKCLKVRSPYDTKVFLVSLIEKLGINVYEY